MKFLRFDSIEEKFPYLDCTYVSDILIQVLYFFLKEDVFHVQSVSNFTPLLAKIMTF